MKRRQFLHQSISGSLVLASSSFPFQAFANDPDITKLVILHTNDVHSRIEPFPMDGSRNAGMGGAVRRAQMIEEIRNKEKNVLLFDCGDIFQGTPYFNVFGGELEIKLMTEMKYDASTMGNHDFDNGIDGFIKQLKHADFPFIVSNYDFSDTALHNKVHNYRIFELEEVRVGVIGVGIELRGLVPDNLFGGTQYLDPIMEAQKQAAFLKKEENCDYVICLSHLGYKYSNSKVSDIVLAQNTEDIDLILGGHTHTFMSQPDIQRNKKGKEVVISQAGWAGILLGQVQIQFEKNKKKKCISCKNTFVK